MGLLDYFFNKSDNSQSPADQISLMDRFMNPITQAGLAMLSNQPATEGIKSGQEYLKQKKTDMLQKYFMNSIDDPTERAMMMMAPDQYVAAKLRARAIDKPVVVGENSPGYILDGTYHPLPGGTNGMRVKPSTVDLTKLTPESRAAVSQTGDPNQIVLDPNNPDAIKERAQTFNAASDNIEARLMPIRQGMSSIRIANKLLQGEGGPSDYGALVSFVKATDPGTAAREGEVSAASAAQGYLNIIGEIAQKAQGNGFMTAEQKKQMSAALKGMTQIYKDNYDNVVGDYVPRYAKAFNLDEKLLRGVPISFNIGDVNPPPTPTLPDAASTLAGGILQESGVGPLLDRAKKNASDFVDGAENFVTQKQNQTAPTLEYKRDEVGTYRLDANGNKVYVTRNK